MKQKTLSFLLIGLIFFLVVPVWVAAAKKPPKTSCWEWPAGSALEGYKLAIAIKRSGMKIRDANGAVRLYTIQGAMNPGTSYYNIDGSAYWDPSSGYFEGSFSGPVGSSFIACRIYLHPVDSVAIAGCDVAPAFDTYSEVNITRIPCRDETLN